jgi:hypothetical protein
MSGGEQGGDRATREAERALVFRLRNRDGADDEWFAAEYVASLKLLGWLPPGRPVPDWRTRGDGSGTPDPSGPGGAEYLAFKAARGWVPAARDGDDP